MHAPPHRSHASPHFFPAHGSGSGQGGAVERHWPAPSQKPSAAVHPVPEHGSSHRTPQASPAHDATAGGQKFGVRPPGTQVPLGSQFPGREGTMQGGVALAQGGSIVQGSPQVLPAHAAFEGSQSPPTRATHRPKGSHAFTTAVSTQSVAPGGQAVHVSPHAFPAQAS